MHLRTAQLMGFLWRLLAVLALAWWFNQQGGADATEEPEWDAMLPHITHAA
jgi:hypothetical protein